MKTGGRRYCTVVHFGPLPVIKACCNGFAMHSVFFELSFCKETFLGLSCVYGEVMGNLKRYYPVNTIMHLLKNEPVWEWWSSYSSHLHAAFKNRPLQAGDMRYSPVYPAVGLSNIDIFRPTQSFSHSSHIILFKEMTRIYTPTTDWACKHWQLGKS